MMNEDKGFKRVVPPLLETLSSTQKEFRTGPIFTYGITRFVSHWLIFRDRRELTIDS